MAAHEHRSQTRSDCAAMRRLLFRLSAIGLGGGGALLVVELLLRLAGVGYGNAPLVSDPILHHAHPRAYEFTVHDPAGEYGGHQVRFDDEGLVVDPAGLPPHMAAPTQRVAFMGDSFTEALQVPFRESFVGILRAAAAPGVTLRNYGVSSYSPLLYGLQWEQHVRRFRPTQVFLLLSANDVRDDRLYAESASSAADGRLLAVPGPSDHWWTPLLRRSYAARFARRAQLQLAWAMEHRGEAGEVAGNYLEENPDPSGPSADCVLRLGRAVEATGARFTLMAVPSKARLQGGAAQSLEPEFSDKWRAWAQRHGVGFLDLAEPFRRAAQSGTPPFFARDIHFNRAGHGVVAAVISAAHPDLFPGASAPEAP